MTRLSYLDGAGVIVTNRALGFSVVRHMAHRMQYESPMSTTTLRPLIDAFVTLAAGRHAEYIARGTAPHLNKATHEVRVGGRYAKIVRTIGGAGCVLAFVDMQDGSIYKPASHKSPAKGARGNVRDVDGGLSCLTDMGTVCYAR